MNRKSQANELGEIVARYVAGIAIPAFDARAIRARMRSSAAAKPASFFGSRRRTLAALVVAAALLALLPNIPAVVAQVQHALRAFAVVNGRTVPLTIRVVDLAQARADMPFTVIAPAAIPAGLQPTIRELYSGTSFANARLMFDYSGPLPARVSASAVRGPGLTIIETSSSASAGNAIFISTSLGRAHLPPLPPPTLPSAGKPSAYGLLRQGGTAVKIKAITWVAHGTRVSLLSPPGLLTPGQTIRTAMSQ
ncbi:MAG: hypothetical protein ACREM2_01565 [Vulcanimicrobiaceae bacterium]